LVSQGRVAAPLQRRGIAPEVQTTLEAPKTAAQLNDKVTPHRQGRLHRGGGGRRAREWRVVRRCAGGDGVGIHRRARARRAARRSPMAPAARRRMAPSRSSSGEAGPVRIRKRRSPFLHDSRRCDGHHRRNPVSRS
jgi:hypothetical protein